jgi:hypothetical protein
VIIKIISVMLIVLAALAIFGRVRLKLPGRKPPAKLAAPCPECGRPRIGTGPCPCKTGG